jgi:hypothetical protein
MWIDPAADYGKPAALGASSEITNPPPADRTPGKSVETKDVVKCFDSHGLSFTRAAGGEEWCLRQQTLRDLAPAIRTRPDMRISP